MTAIGEPAAGAAAGQPASSPAVRTTPVKTVPAYRTLPRLARDPLRAFEQIGRDSDGALTRVSLGLTRPYLVSHPDHVQHVLRRPETYAREGMLWKPLRRLEGDGIAGEGPGWQASRRLLQPLFTARHINALLPTMVSAVTEGLDQLAARGAGGRPFDLVTEMTSMMHRVMVRVFFGNRITTADADLLGAAISEAFQSLGWRILLPFVGESVPLPGDRAFTRAVRTVDSIIYPLIHSVRRGADVREGDDLVAMLARMVDEDGQPLPDKRVRDDVVAMFIAGTETTALAMTWLWLLLAAHPEVSARLTGEVDDVVGDSVPEQSHLPRLVYTRMVLQEAVRLYPVGWVVPRTVAAPDILGGAHLHRGATVLLSPYLTHRLPEFWEEPYAFRPERFADGAPKRHRFAYYPFGAGVHQCLGNHFFLIEGQLAVAGLLSRFRPEVRGSGSLEPRATATLRPRHPPQLVLHPRR